MENNLPKLRELSDAIIERGSEIATDVQAEDAIVWLLDVEKWAKETIERLKSEIARKAKMTDPNFTSIQGENVKIEYRAFGSEFKLSKDFTENDYDPAFMTKKVETKYTPIASAIKSYEAETGELPKGIEKNDREKTIVIKMTK